MGILLSKNKSHYDGRSTVEKQKERAHPSAAKRRRDSAIGPENAVTHRKRKRLKANHSIPPLFIEELTFNNGIADDNNTKGQHCMTKDSSKCATQSESSISMPQKKRKRKRKSNDSTNHEQKGSTPQPNGQIPLMNIETPVITPKRSPQISNLAIEGIDPLTTTPKPRRKRKQPTSPYFEIADTQSSSSQATPTPSLTRDISKKKSKISIIETTIMPASLPHFRPTSPDEFGLIQEKLRHEPWKMLVAVIFLNVTTAKMALPLLGQLFERWPTPEALSQAIFEELSAFLYPIGLYNTRARRLIDFSTMWLASPPQHDVLTKRKGLTKYPATAISHLPGMGVYALDSWRMFCAGEEEWRNLQPADKELQAWMRWRWAREGPQPPEYV